MKNLLWATILIFLLALNSTPLNAQLSGTYTIGSGGNYSTFTAAVNDLTSQGVSGAVIFNVLNGTYTDQFVIGQITGASSSNTIAFQSQSGNATDVALQFTPTASNNYVVRLNQADYITFQNMTLIASGSTSYGVVIKLDGDANNNRFIDNILTSVSTTSSSANLAILYADGDSLDNTVISGNTFSNGSYGVYLDGVSTSVPSSGLQITGNTFSTTGYNPIFARYQTSPQINGNTMTVPNASRGMELHNCNGALQVQKNTISLSSSSYGIYLYQSDGGTGIPTPRGLIANNVVAIGGTSTAYGIYLYTCTNQDLYYNSVNITSTSISSGQALRVENAGGSGINIVNNIFANQGGGYSYYNAGA
ncbi:MAG: hypothetical protein HY707_09740, partial [Ignavibacteriae bacterium]|nr:hypothetical protein [Ignavibacteriota bacterium]